MRKILIATVAVCAVVLASAADAQAGLFGKRRSHCAAKSTCCEPAPAPTCCAPAPPTLLHLHQLAAHLHQLAAHLHLRAVARLQFRPDAEVAVAALFIPVPFPIAQIAVRPSIAV